MTLAVAARAQLARHHLRAELPALVTTGLGGLVCLFVARQGNSKLINEVIGGLVGLALVLLLCRRPSLVAVLAVVLVPTVPLLPSVFLAVGVPLSTVKQYGHIKDLVAASLVAALLVRGQRRAGPLDAVEWCGLAYLLLVTVYLVAPVASAGLTAPPFSIRIYGWRFDAEWVVILLALRRLETAHRLWDRLVAVVVGLAVVDLALCAYQTASPAGYNRFLVDQLQVSRYIMSALGDTAGSSTDLTTYNAFGGSTAIRPGGLSVNPLTTGGICIIFVAVLTPALLRRQKSSLRLAGLVAAAGTAALTLTRSAVLGCFVALVVVLVAASRDRIGSRARAVILLIPAAAVLVPVIAGSKLADRVSSGLAGTDASVTSHGAQTSSAYDIATHQLLGAGLGTGPAVGLRFQTLQITAENAYIQIALEIGVAGLVVFLAFLVALFRSATLHRRLQTGSDAVVVPGVLLGLLAMSIFLDPWIDFGTLFVLAVLVGVAVPHNPAGRRRPEASG